MFQTFYDRLSTSEKTQSHRRQRSWRLWRQPAGLNRRLSLVPLVLLLFFTASFIRLDPWSRIPAAPPTPFVLSSSASSYGNITEESIRSDLTHALSSMTRLKAPKYRPHCPKPITSRYSPISASHSNFTVFLALDLSNAQWVLPTFIQELPVLLSFMGSHRFHVSILENGSSDSSASLLVILARALAALGTSYDIIVKGENIKSRKEDNHRIVELARLRNAVLDPLYTGKAAKAMGIHRFDVVLFMNDIIWCTNDILEILHEHVAQKSHMTCTTDWESDILYDRWVARTMSGLPFYSQPTLIRYFNGPKAYSPPIPRPLPYDDHERQHFEALKPFQVFSCWNGATVIDAQAFFPFSSSNGDNLESSSWQAPSGPQHSTSDSLSLAADSATKPGIRFRTALNDFSNVTQKASECFLLSVDLWKRGLGKIMLVPKASVAYDVSQYERVRQDGGRAVAHPIGIEQPIINRVGGSAHSRVSASLSSHDKYRSLDNEAKILWSPSPPETIVYHDYAWWHEKERWGPWDEA